MKIHQLTVEEALAGLRTGAGGWQYGQPLDASDPRYLYATTVSLGTIVLLQLVNVFLCRSPVRSLRATGLRGNPLLLADVVMALGALLLIAYTPLGNGFFGTLPVSWADWLWVLPFAVALIVFEEARKWWLRHAAAGRQPPGG